MNNEEIYLYLDLNGRLDHNFFKKDNIYFKMVNINSDSPLIQIGNYVFQGNYEDFLGTKVFFVEDKNYKGNENVFIKESPIHLKYIAKTAKVIQLQWRKIPTNVVQVDHNECTDLKFTETYNAVLEKLEKGALNMQDIVSDISQENSVPSPEKIVTEKKDISEMDIEEKSSNNDVSEQIENVDTDIKCDIKLNKYDMLKNLAGAPVNRRDIAKMYEVNKKDLAVLEDASNFSVLRQLFLQNILLKKDIVDSTYHEFNKYVDVEQSIKDGVISDVGKRELSEEEKGLLLSVENFDNFTLPMKLAYLTEQLDEYKRLMATKDLIELRETDAYGRTFKDKYRLLKKLTKQIWYHIYANCSDYV